MYSSPPKAPDRFATLMPLLTRSSLTVETTLYGVPKGWNGMFDFARGSETRPSSLLACVFDAANQSGPLETSERALVAWRTVYIPL